MSFNQKRRQGDDLPIRKKFTDANGQPIALVGGTYKASVKTPTGQLIAKMTVTPDPDQVGVLVIDPVDTSQWPVGKNVWDLKIKFPNQRNLTLPRSKTPFTWEIFDDVTEDDD